MAEKNGLSKDYSSPDICWIMHAEKNSFEKHSVVNHNIVQNVPI